MQLETDILAYRPALELCSKSQSLLCYEKQKACDGFVTELKIKLRISLRKYI